MTKRRKAYSAGNAPGVPVYVLDRDGSPLMPTFRNGHVRRLLSEGRAVVVRRVPFTVRLTYDPSTHVVQPVTVGVDPGYGTAGISAGTAGRELLCAEVKMREDIVGKISSRRECRRTRRSRKLRHRAPRFDNRKRKEGVIPPSAEALVGGHLRVIGMVCGILPVRRIVLEVAQFDVRRLKDPDVSGKGYMHGETDGFWNTREYVLHRDGHRCRNCGGKSGDRVLEVHHLESRKTGGDSPGNLVTLCRTCHARYHRGEIGLDLRRTPPLKPATAMNVMRNALFRRLSGSFPGIEVVGTFAYRTKTSRHFAGLLKSHANDAYCIAGNLYSERCPVLVLGRQVPRHTRSLHVMKPSKGGRRRNAVAPHTIGRTSLQRYDAVRYDGRISVIAGSTGGRLVLRDMEWKRTTKEASVNPGKVKFLYRKKGSTVYMAVPARDTELVRMMTEWDYVVRDLFMAADKGEGAFFGFMHETFQDANMEIMI